MLSTEPSWNSIHEALNKRCYINFTGYSAHPSAFGLGNPTVPGIIDRHLGTGEAATKSDALKKILLNHISTKEAFIETNDPKYFEEEKVYAKEGESEGV